MSGEQPELSTRLNNLSTAEGVRRCAVFQHFSQNAVRTTLSLSLSLTSGVIVGGERAD